MWAASAGSSAAKCRAAEMRTEGAVTCEQTRDLPSEPLTERSDRLTISPLRRKVDPFRDAKPDSLEKPYLPPAPGRIPPMEHPESPAEPEPAEDPEKTGDKPHFP